MLSKDAPSRADEAGADAPPPERRPGPGFRAGGPPRAPQKRPLGIRDLRIRNKVVVVLLLPVLTVLALGGLRITTSTQDYLQSGHIRQFAELSTRATSAAHELQTEYLDAIQFLLAKQPADLATYKNQMDVTDTALNGYKSARDTARGHLNANSRALVDEVDRQLSGLSELRSDLIKGAALPLAATSYRYPALINRLIGLKQEAALGSGNHQLAQSVQAASAYTSGKEYLTEEGALLIEVFSTGRFDTTSYRDFLSALANKSIALHEQFDPAATAAQQDVAIKADASGASDKVIGFEQTAIKGQNVTDLGVKSGQWRTAVTDELKQMRTVEKRLDADLVDIATHMQNRAGSQALLEGILIPLVILATVGLSYVVARSMIFPLQRLRSVALDVAGQRLPRLVRRLEEGQPVRAEDEAPPLDIETSEEIGQVARAFNAVHAEAVHNAVQQYDLRRNVAQMFVNLARRSQTLVDRQIQLIDQLEQSERDPDRLEDLFKLDHLATRMRRNDENLLVLAGEESARRWSRPVPLVNVLRAAASEVEQYARIELTGIETDLAVSGHAVNDLVHLVAELLENATSFSSPRTKVIVASRMVGPNCMVEIEDQGIGMSPAQLAEINERLSRPPVIDVTLSKTMGLFVVGRLSARHRVKVQLRSSPLGGVIAMVLLPLEAIVRPPAAPTPAALGGGTARQFQGGRPALPAGAPGSPSGPPGSLFGTPAPTGAYGGSYDNPYENSYGPGSPPAGLPSSPYVSGSDLPYRTPGASGGEPPAGSQSGPLFSTGDVRPWRPESGPPDARPEPRRTPPPVAEPPPVEDSTDAEFAERAEPADGSGPRPTPGFRLDGPGAAFLDADTHAMPRIGGPDAPLEDDQQIVVPEPAPAAPLAPAGEAPPAEPERPPADQPADQDQPGMESQIVPAVSSTPPPPPTTAPPTRTVIPRVADVDPQRPPARAPETAAARAAATPQPADDDGLLIFSAVESEWFRSRTPGGQVMGQPGSGISPEPAPEERAERSWDTPADEGWRAAEVAARPPTGGFTRSGLPIRVPQAQLVPGSAAPAIPARSNGAPGGSPMATPPGVRAPVPPADSGPMEPLGPPGKHRTPESVRGLLSSYRQGIERGREAGRSGLAGPDERENV